MKYLKELLNYQEKNNELFNKCLNDVYGKDEFDLNEKVDIEKLNFKDKEAGLYYLLKTSFKIKEYNIKKLAKSIQNSRSGIGGAAITKYECKFCGKEEIWANTATPGICSECAEEMARRMVFGLGNENLEDKFKNKKR